MYKKIEEIVEKHFNLDPDQLRNIGNMTRNVTDARSFTWYILRYRFGYSARTLAVEYKVSRRSIFYGMGNVRNGLKYQPFYQQHYRQIMEKVKENCPEMPGQ